VERSNLGMTSEGTIDDNDFYRFAIPDLVEDTEFIDAFDRASKKLKNDIPQTDINEVEKKSRFEQMKIRLKADQFNTNDVDALRKGINRLILFEPRGNAVRNNNFDVIQSEQLEIKIKDAFENLNVDFMQIVKIGSKELKESSSEIYNEKAVLMNTLTQLLEFKGLQLFPVDYTEIEGLRKKYQTDKVVFIVLDYYVEPWRTKLAGLVSLTTFPFLSFAAQRSAEKFT
jgi:hypothetical protein